MQIEITLERTKQSLLEFPKETICSWSATDFEKETAEVLSQWFEVDYREGSQRFPDIVIDDWGLECKKSERGWRILGNSVNQVRKTMKNLVEVWLIFLNQKVCDIRYGLYGLCAVKVIPDIRYRHLIDMEVSRAS